MLAKINILGRKILESIFILAVKIDCHIISALILAILTKPMSKKCGKYRILALSKPIFNEDVKSIDEVSENLLFLQFPRLLMGEYLKKYAGDRERTHEMWTVKHAGTVEQKAMNAAVGKMFRHLRRFLKFDAIFAGNYTYPAQQELFRVATDHNIPVIVLYKEGMAPKGSFTDRLARKLYTGRQFFGKKILFYNSTIRDALIAAGIPGITKANSAVVGIPRIDKFIHAGKGEADNKRIVLFAFDPNQKVLRYIENETNRPEFTKRCVNFQTDFVRYCIENPQYKLIIKTKGAHDANTVVSKMLLEKGIGDLPDNIEVNWVTSSYDLIRKCKFVAGYASTTLLEGMIFDRFILCPDMIDIIQNERFDFFWGYLSAVNYIKNYKHLVNLMIQESNINCSSFETKEKILRPLLFSLDGKSSKRVETQIVNVINE